LPRLSAWFIRASLVYLLAGFTLGAVLLASNGLDALQVVWVVLPAHIEFLLVGWVVQLALGTAYWILPRLLKGPARGSPRLGWAAFWLFNAGILLAASNGLLPGVAQVAGRGLEIAGAGVIAWLLWPRVKAYGM